MRIGVSGSRHASLKHVEVIAETIRKYSPKLIVHGDCPGGVDKIADKVAVELGIPVERYPADWALGTDAGPRRNRTMAELKLDLWLAFPMSKAMNKGTLNLIAQVVRVGTPIFVTPLEPASLPARRK